MNTTYIFQWGREVKQKPPIPLFQIPLLALIVFIAFVGVSVPSVSWAATITVDTVSDTSTASNCTLKMAIKAATDDASFSETSGCTKGDNANDGGDIIVLSEVGNYTIANQQISSKVTIKSSPSGSSSDTFIQAADSLANSSDRVFFVQGTGDLTLEGVTVRYGKAKDTSSIQTQLGGGIYNQNNGKLTLKNCIVIGNTAVHGGGIYNNGTLTLDNTTISDNLADGGNGGGIRNKPSGSPGTVIIQNKSVIQKNTSTLCGGGITSSNTSITIQGNSSVTDNLYKSMPNDIVANINVNDTSVVSSDSNAGVVYGTCEAAALAQIDGYAKKNDASQLTMDELKDATPNASGDSTPKEENLDGYKEKVEEASAIPDESTLNNLVKSVNNGTSKIADFIDDDTTNSLTDEELLAELKKAGLKNIVDANVDKYRAALTDGGLTKADGDTVAELQTIIDTTNLEKIKSYAGGTGDLTIAQLQVSNLTNVNPALLDEYKKAISGATIRNYPDGWEDLQAIIDAVNAANPSSSGNTNSNTGDNTNSGSGFGTPPPQPDYYRLNIASPNGRVTSDKKDIEGNAIDCDKGNGHCGGLFKRGTTIKLTATAPTGLIFDSWDGSSDCSDGKVTMNNTRNCKALFYGDPNYVPPEEDDDTTNTDNGTADAGTGDTGTGTSNPVYVDSFSIRAKIQGKNACYQDANPHPNDVVVAGFILQGAGTEQVLIRALDLEQDVNPKILVKQTILGADGLLRGVPVAKNDAWELNPRSTEIPEYLTPDKQTDAALLLDLSAGAYTVTTCMSPNSKVDTGVGQVSITLLQNNLQFTNVSGRGYVSGGANDAITGFTVYGVNGNKTAYIKGRALGETPETFIDSAIEIGRIYFDPQINQVTGSRLKNVSNWLEEPSINTLPLGNELADTDAAASMNFGVGSYTTILSSENGTAGLGIISIEFTN
jgi:hypothetical protein